MDAEFSARREFNLALGSRVARRRGELRLTQQELSDRTAALGFRVPGNTISRLEAGASLLLPGFSVLCQALECSPEFLLGWIEEPDTHEAGESDTGGTRVSFQSRKHQRQHLSSVSS